MNLAECGRPLYRSKNERKLLVRTDKADLLRCDSSTATLMIPTTDGSKLAKLIRETLIKHPGPKGTRVRVLERPGIPIMRGIAVNNPFKLQSCGRDNCPLVAAGKDCEERCRVEGVTYRAVCEKCNQCEDINVVQPEVERAYEGETSRTLYTRYLQHIAD